MARLATKIPLLLAALSHLGAQDADPPEETLVSLNLPEEIEVKLLIGLVSSELGLNVLYDEQVGGKRIVLKAPEAVPRGSLLGILRSALRMKGLALVDAEEPGWLKVVDAGDLSRIADPATERSDTVATTELFELEHVPAQTIQETVKKFLTTPGGNLLALPDQRSLVVTDYSSNMDRVRELLALLDRPSDPVEIEVLAVEHLGAADAARGLKELIDARARADRRAGMTRPIEIVELPRLHRVVVLGSREDVTRARELMGHIDLPLGLETRLYRFRNVSPKRVDELARSLAGPGGEGLYESAADEPSGTLVVTAREDLHEKIERLRDDLDSELRQAEPVVRFYKVRNGTALEILATIREIKGSLAEARRMPGAAGAEESADSQAAAEGAGVLPRTPELFTEDARGPRRPVPERSSGTAFDADGARLVADPNTNTIIVSAPPDVHSSYEDLIRRLDQRRPQVLLEITLVTIDTSRGFSLGVEIAGDEEGSRHRVLAFSSFGLSEVDPETAGLDLVPGLGFNGAVLSKDIADAVVRALATSGRSKVVSAPKILVNDNATGSLNSVQDAPFTSVNASTTVATTSFGGFENAGTTINVTPHIAEGDHLNLEYSITLSTFTGESGEGIPPPRQRNEVQSTVTVPDGHTVVVGGLSREDRSESVTKVPLLGDIPLLGYLFSSRSRTSSTSTLFAFIRPVILRDDRFQDLKFVSEDDKRAAGMPEEYPESAPLLMP